MGRGFEQLLRQYFLGKNFTPTCLASPTRLARISMFLTKIFLRFYIRIFVFNATTITIKTKIDIKTSDNKKQKSHFCKAHNLVHRALFALASSICSRYNPRASSQLNLVSSDDSSTVYSLPLFFHHDFYRLLLQHAYQEEVLGAYEL